MELLLNKLEEKENYKVKIKENSRSLSQARCTGIEYTVMELKDNTFSNIIDIFFCKDYFNEFLLSEKYKLPSGPVYGFSHNHTGYLDNTDYIYIGLTTRKYHEASIQKNNTQPFRNLSNFLGLIDAFFIKINKGKISELFDTDNKDWKVVKVPVEYTDYFYIFALYATLLRVGLFYNKGTFMEFLSTLSTSNYIGVYNEDLMNINNTLHHIKAIELGYIDNKPLQYVTDYLKNKVNGSWHNIHNYSGFVGHTNTSENLGYKLLFLYGSLREGMYNYIRFKEQFGNEFIRINDNLYTIDAMNLYSLGSYPTVIPSSNYNDHVIGELFLVSNKCFDSINRMELGAGYSSKKVGGHYKNSGVQALIYYQSSTTSSEKIINGDWVDYLTKDSKTVSKKELV